jgi:ParB/RepB/Spo0J family partition protein
VKAVIPVRDIVPNPFQARKRIPVKSVRALADEIGELGLWPGSLKGRMKDGKLQLCYGHRRLQALKLLGWKDVEVEIEDLSDEEMAFQGMAENLQRENLSDIEKAEAIKLMIERLIKRGLAEPDALKKVCRILGLSPGWIKDLLSMTHLEAPVQRAIRERDIAGRTALEAHRFGGKDMVTTAIRHHLPVHTISSMAQKIRKIPDEEVRERIRREVIRGRLTRPEHVDQKIRAMMKGRKRRMPSNLEAILQDGIQAMKEFNGTLDGLLIYRRYLEVGGAAATGLRREAAKVGRKVQKLA